MILSSDELEILAYLKSYDGKYVALVEICRSAGGRQKFKESPNWARNLMGRLVDARMIAVNERGHYRFVVEEASAPKQALKPAAAPASRHTAAIVGDDYFPAEPPPPETATARWMSPQIAAILKKSGRKFPGPKPV